MLKTANLTTGARLNESGVYEDLNVRTIFFQSRLFARLTSCLYDARICARMLDVILSTVPCAV